MGILIPVTPADESYLGVESGSCRGQQCWEALALLVSLREWWSFWGQRRVTFTYKGDNVSALTLFAQLKGGSPGLNKIARELALIMSRASFVPDAIAHIPGITNVTADMLSRRLDPSKQFVLPHCLNGAKDISPNVATRDHRWWLASSPPSLNDGRGVEATR